MFYLIIGVIVLASVLLIVVVLAQNPKGGGVSSQFGGSGASQLIGVKKTGDLLEKLTWGFAIAILVLSLSSNILIDSMDGTKDAGVNPDIEKAIESQGNIPLKKAPAQNAFPIDTTKNN
ncbi:MAG TPA: preprotein translocase subunit SecG [Cytophagales bacterium]|nr:preprotein translocase subunit SecG [Cytophagales bacterium]